MFWTCDQNSVGDCHDLTQAGNHTATCSLPTGGTESGERIKSKY